MELLVETVVRSNYANPAKIEVAAVEAIRCTRDHSVWRIKSQPCEIRRTMGGYGKGPNSFNLAFNDFSFRLVLVETIYI